MIADKTKISPVTFMFSVACFLRSSSLLSAFFASIAKQDSWLVVLFGAVVSLPELAVYILLMKAFPPKNLIEINDTVFGKILGKAVSSLYLLFFFTLSALNLRDLGNFTSKSITLNTPMPLILGVFVLLCAWAVYLGIEVVTRYSVVFIIISSIILLVSIISTLNIIDFEHFLPMFDRPLLSYIQSTHIASTIPFGELVVFLMIIPSIDVSPKKIGRYFLGGFLLGAFLISLVIARDVGILGKTISIFSLPSFEALRMITFFDVLTHMEILYSILLITLFFFKITFLFYVSIFGLSRLFNFKSHKPLVLPCCALFTAFSFMVVGSVTQHLELGRRTAPFMWLIFEFLLPLITLITAYIRGIPDKEKQKQQKEAKA